MKRWIILGLIIISLAVVVVCKKTQRQKTVDAAIRVKTAQVEHTQLSRSIRTSGILASSAEMMLSFKLGGIIDRIPVREGQDVVQGQLLAGLKQDEIMARVRQARVGVEKAERDYNRAKNLYEDQVVTLEQLQNAESGLDVARSNLEIAEFNLKHARIHAPSDGRILRKIAESSELVGAGHPVLLFGNQSKLWRLKAGVVDQDVVRLTLGDSAHVCFDAYPREQFKGRISEIAGAPDPMNGLFEVEVTLEPVPFRLFSGLMGGTDIYPSHTEEVSVVPFGALVNVSGSHGYVYRIEADSLAVKVPVEVAYIVEDKAVIRVGLDGIETIVTEGAAYLNGKSNVRIVN